MARPVKQFPTPYLRQKNGSWQIRWGVRGKKFELSVGKIPAPEAETYRLEIEIALRRHEWPDWALAAEPVKRYLRQCCREDSLPQSGGLYEDYQAHLAGSGNSGRWNTNCLAFLRELQDFAGERGETLATATPAIAQAFLDRIPGSEGRRHPTKKRKLSTRNRGLTACKKFYRWAAETGRVRENPFRNCRQVKTEEIEEIFHLTKKERDRLLKKADELGHGLPVWLACHAGLRRGEIQRLKWGDINFQTRKLLVRKSKNKKRRVVDLSGKLLARLKTERRGAKARVVRWREAEDAAWQRDAELLLEELRSAFPKWPPEKLSFYCWRHTFASLLAQAGVSIFKIAGWLGNDVKVCTRHYAAMLPTHDSDIDAAG